MTTVGVETQNHGLYSCHSLEAHRRLILSNDHDDTDAGYQTIANKASIEVSNADASGHAEFISAFHNGTRPQVQLSGDVTFAAGSTLALPGGVTTSGAQTATDLIAQGGGVTVKTADGSTVQASISQAGQLSATSAVISGDASVAGLTVTAAADVAGAVDLGAADSAPGANDGADVTARRDLAVAGELTAARGVVGTATFPLGGGAVFQSNQSVTIKSAAGGYVWSALHNGVTCSVAQTAHGNFTMDDGMGTVRLRLNQGDGSIDCGDVRGDAGEFTGVLDAQAAVTLGAAGASGADVTVRRDLVVAGSLTVNGTTTSVNSTELEIADKKIELGVAAAATTAAAHRTTCSSGLQLGFGGYDDSDDSDTRKSLGNLAMEFGATAADDQFKVSHRMETPALHVQSGGGLRINGTTAGTYCEMTFDEATDRFTITRYVAGGQTKQNTTSFT